MTTSLLLLSLLACGQSHAGGLSKTAELYLDNGLHHLYGLDYAEARADFRKIIEAEPESPFGYLYCDRSFFAFARGESLSRVGRRRCLLRGAGTCR